MRVMVKVPVLSRDVIDFLSPFSVEVTGGGGWLTCSRVTLSSPAVRYGQLASSVWRLRSEDSRREDRSDSATVVCSRALSYP